MISDLLPFDANIGPADGTPYLLRLSQGFNEAIWNGSGLPQGPELAHRIQSLQDACNGRVGLNNAQDIFLSRLMALAWHLEYLTTALVGDTTTLSDHEAFLNSLAQLGSELADLRQHPVVGEWVVQRLRDAQFRHFQRFGQVGPQQTLPSGPVVRPVFSPWTGLPHLHAVLVAPPLPPLIN